MTSTWKAGVMLVLAAAAGGAIGSVLTARAGHGTGHDHERGYSWYVEMLDRELKLTPAQRDSLVAILRRRDGSMDSLWAEMRPRISTLRESIRSEIRAQLTAEQQARYGEITARLDAERRRKQQEHERKNGSN